MKWKLYLVMVVACLWNSFSHAQNTPPAITVEGNQEFCGSDPMNIVTSVTITDPDVGDNTLNEVFIQISEGYTIGQDQLQLNGTYPNITSNWNVAEGKLTLQGPADFDEFTDAISNVQYQTTETNFTQDKFFSINLGDANYLPSTGHYYIYVPAPGITWTNARDAAETLTYFGIQGYLATITNDEESQFAGEQSPGLGWIGANDSATEGTWQWVTGPEAGQTFWVGNFNGSAPNGEFSNWNVGEPNDLNGEDYAHITDPSIGNVGSWNDLPNTGSTDPNNPYYPKGYLVEFGGMPGDPEINLSGSTVIVTPKLDLQAETACGDAIVNLSVNANTPTVLWYETPSSTAVLNDGLTYEVLLTETTTFWLLPLFQGCTDGARIPFTVDYLPSPDAMDITIAQCDDAVQDGLTTFGLEVYSSDIANGITQDRDVLFFEDSDLTSEISNGLYNNTSNPQTIYAQVINTATGCSNVSEVLLQVNTTAIAPLVLEACDGPSETGQAAFDLSELDAQIEALGLENTEVSFYESYENALVQTNMLSNTYTNTDPYLQTIYVRIEENGACYTIGEVQLIVNRLPSILNEETFWYCLNRFPQTITLSGGVIDDIPNNYYYQWSTGETTIDIEVNEPGTYTVEVSFVEGCSKTKTISVLPSNIATITAFEVQDIASNNVITVLTSGEGEYVYALDDSNGPYQTSNVFEFVEAGIHTVYVKDVKNDCGIVAEDVSVIGYPKFFTPNGDSYNDTWQLKGVSEQFQPRSKVFIFDRFGKLLYTLNTPFDVWDGTFNGEPMPSSDYWFSATLEDGRTFKGHFTLKR